MDFDLLNDDQLLELEAIWRNRNYREIEKFINKHKMLKGCSCIFNWKDITEQLDFFYG